MNLFNHEVNKRKLVNIAYGFDNFCKLIEEVYAPFIKESRMINRIGSVETLKEKLNNLHKIYDDPFGELVKFSENKFKQYSEGYEDYEDYTEYKEIIPGFLKILLPKDNLWKIRKFPDPYIMSWRMMSDSASKYDAYAWSQITSKMDDFLLAQVDKYYEIINFLSSHSNYSCEISKMFWEKFDMQCKKEIKIEDYEKQKQEYKNKIESANKTLDMILKEAHSLHQDSWEDVLIFLIKDRWLSFEDIEGSSNKVLHIKSDLPAPHKSIVIKAEDKYSNSLMSEKRLIEYVNKRLTSNIVECYKRQQMRNVKDILKEELGHYQFFRHPAFKPVSIDTDIKIKLPEIMFFSDKINEDYNWLVLREEPRDIRYEVMLDKKINNDFLNAITQFLAFIHATIPENVSTEGKIDISDYVKGKLDKPYLNLKDDTKSEIYRNLTPVIDSLSSAPYVFNKDAHPGNFIIHEEKNQDDIGYYLITAIDWEDKGFRPLHMDLVSLLECSDNLTCEEKKDFIQNYIHFFNVYNHKKEFEKLEYDSNFKLAYSNAVVYYSIILSSVFSNPKMKDCSQKRRNFLEKAVKSINDIKEEHKEYYNKYKENYSLLEDTLKESISYLS